MRLAFGLGRHEICLSAELRSGDRLVPTPDPAAARDLLRGLLGDAHAMARLRRILVEESFRDLWGASDHEVLDDLARRMVSGRLRIASGDARRPPAIPITAKPVAAPALPPEPVRTRAPVPAPPARPAPAPAPPSVEMSAQAAALVEAARDGTPFCEECAKARAGQSQQAAF